MSNILTNYILTEQQHNFLNYELPRVLYEKYNRYGALFRILEDNFYDDNDRVILKKLRQEYIQEYYKK